MLQRKPGTQALNSEFPGSTLNMLPDYVAFTLLVSLQPCFANVLSATANSQKMSWRKHFFG